jgi:hypothetical protein
VYVGSFTSELGAARAYDLAILKLRPYKAVTNFPAHHYTAYMRVMEDLSAEEWVIKVRTEGGIFVAGQAEEDVLWSPSLLAQPDCQLVSIH